MEPLACIFRGIRGILNTNNEIKSQLFNPIWTCIPESPSGLTLELYWNKLFNSQIVWNCIGMIDQREKGLIPYTAMSYMLGLAILIYLIGIGLQGKSCMVKSEQNYVPSS